MWRDLRNAVRALAQTPTFTITATLALALAIGANGAIFGLIDGLWFRPPGVRDPGTVVRIFATTPKQTEGAWSWPEYLDVRSRISGLQDVAVRGRRGAVLTAADGSQELLLVNVVSTNFFQMLGVHAALGRVFSADDGAALEAAPGVVLGHAFWRSYFGSDPAVVGRTIQLGRAETSRVTVLAVLPPSFRELEASFDRDLWMPPQTWLRITRDTTEFEQRDDRWFELVARRRSDVSVDAIGAQLSALAATLAQEYPAASAGRGARVVNDLDYRLENAGVQAKAMLGLVLLLVLITCVNVANLLLARAASRAHELAVRTALGAGRWRLMRFLSVESLLLGVLGAIGGLIVAAWLIRLLPALMPAPPGMRSFAVFQTDGRVMLFTATVTLLTTMLFAIAPALIGARTDIASLIKGATGAADPGGMLKRVLVGGQVAISLVLISVAASLARSYVAAQQMDIGFTRRPLLTLWTTFGANDPVTGAEAVRQLGALPGVGAVAVAIRAPLSLSGGGLARPVKIPDAPVDERQGVPQVKFNAVSANYFDVLGTRLVGGRTFSAEEERGGEATVVVSEQFVRQFLSGRQAIGSIILVADTPHRVIGIAQDAVVNAIGEGPQSYMYLPFWRGRYGETTFVLESTGEVATLASAARTTLRKISPQLEPRRMVTIANYIEYATSLHRTTAALASILGFVGLTLTAIGVYGVVAYRTTRRTREIGVRMALGAKQSQVLALVLRGGLRLGLVGVLIGLPLAIVATDLTGSMLEDIEAWNPMVFAFAALLVLSAVWLATMIPARRATKVDPSSALRHS